MAIGLNDLKLLDGEIRVWLKVADKITNPYYPPDVKALRLDILRTYFRFAAHMISDGNDLSSVKIELWSHIYAEYGNSFEDISKSLKRNLYESFTSTVPIHIQDAVFHDKLDNDSLASVALYKIENIGLILLHILGDGKHESDFHSRYGRLLVNYLTQNGVLCKLPEQDTVWNNFASQQTLNNQASSYHYKEENYLLPRYQEQSLVSEPDKTEEHIVNHIILHLQLLGYTCSSYETIWIVKRNDQTKYAFYKSGGIITFSRFITRKQNSKAKREEFIEFANKVNNITFISRFMVDDNTNLRFEAYYCGSYSKEMLTQFLDTWNDDFQLMSAMPDTNEFI